MLLLYPDSLITVISCFPDLHSTMLLLYHWWVENIVHKICIYIPLCFYFIRGLLSKISTEAEFTFHYASTLSEESRIRSTIEPHLHSTMLLLYQTANVHTAILHANLHFTMLLLYPDRILYKQGSTEFTFHYASTLSGISYLIYQKLHHLHSTMLLLYQITGTPIYNIHTDLHSTMLLLYHSSTFLSRSSILIYIPLCFYFI